MLAAAPLLAQSATGDIEGIVTDLSGAGVPDAAILVANTATGAERTITTDAAGRFAAPGLPVGPYEVTASRAGLATRRQESLQLPVGETITLRLELTVAAAPDTLTVAGTPPTLEPTRSDARSTVNARDLAHLPVSGRSFLDLALTVPGVVRDPRGGISISGLPAALNNVAVDGSDASVFPETAGTQPILTQRPYQFGQETIHELQVVVSAPPAEYGRAAAGVLNAVTRSGTNRLSGSVFEFHGNTALAGRRALDDAFGLPKGAYGNNQFGGVIGGPAVPDRHFLLFGYDGWRSTRTNAVRLNVPAVLPRDAFTGLALQQLQPLATSWDRTVNQDVFLGRTDHELTGSHRATFRYNDRVFEGVGFENAGPQISWEATGTSTVSTRSLLASLGSVLAPTLVNDLRVQWTVDRAEGAPNSNNPQADVHQGGALVLRIGRHAVSPRETRLSRLQAANTLTLVRGTHKIKAGVDAQFDDLRSMSTAHFSGTYVFQTLAAFGRGSPAGRDDSYTQAFPGSATTPGTTNPDGSALSLFVQDQWRASGSVTVNAGVRYDVQTFAQPEVRNDDPQLAAAGLDAGGVRTDWNNIAPRLGVAWAPGGRRYVVRGGYGLLYGRTASALVAAAYANNGITVETLTFRGAAGDPIPFYPGRVSMPPAQPVVRPTVVGFDRAYKSPRTHQANAAVEWEWMPDTTLAATYLFARADSLTRSTDVNIGAAEPREWSLDGSALPHYAFAPGPFPNFARIVSFQSTAESRYDGVALELRRRFSQGYQYRLAYTLGWNEDTAPDATAAVPGTDDDRKFASNPTDFEVDRAPGARDQRHRLVASTVYTTDLFADRFDGWVETVLQDFTLGIVWTLGSGLPYSGYASSDLNADGNRLNDVAPGTRRHEFRLPAFVSFDVRATRRIGLGDTRELHLMWEAFNLLNRPNYVAVDTMRYSANGTTLIRNPGFGDPTVQADPRLMQVAVRFVF
jgi:outer membrane receptor protein involved in Fe transport